jgi:hypothetical protein
VKHIAFAIALALTASAAEAAIVNWSASLSAANEVGMVVGGEDATGQGAGSVDTETGLLTWDISWSGLTGDAMRLHFHNAPVGVNGGIVVSIFDFVATDSPVSGSASLDSAGVAALLAGNFYLNLHTEQNPGGEIRGQVDPIPLPAGLPLLLGGAGIFWLLQRRTA